MAVAVATSQTTGFTTSASLTLTKPSGVAVGDLLFASFVILSSTGTTFPVTAAPSGWTADKNINVNTGNGHLATYYKVADSGDVSATDYTWTLDGSRPWYGNILRITGQRNVSFLVSNSAVTGGVVNNFDLAAGITPNLDNSLLIASVYHYSAAGGTETISNYAIVTSNPTWTEVADSFNGTGGIAVAHALRAAGTFTGNLSGNVLGGNNARVAVILASISPNQSVSVSDTQGSTDSITAFRGLVASVSDTLDAEDTLIDVIKSRAWTNQTKPSTDPWVNRSK